MLPELSFDVDKSAFFHCIKFIKTGEMSKHGGLIDGNNCSRFQSSSSRRYTSKTPCSAGCNWAQLE